MADAPRGGGGARGGGFGSRGDRGGGERGRGRGGRRGPRRGANKNEEKEWQPVTKLGRLVKAGKIKSMEEIYLHSLPIKEYQIVDWFLPKLKDEVMKVRDSFVACGWELYGFYIREVGAGNEWIDYFSSCCFMPASFARIDQPPKFVTFAHPSFVLDQTSAKADASRSTYAFQGHCRHRGLGRTRRAWDQNVQGSSDCDSGRHHHRQVECAAHSPRILGHIVG